MLTIVLLVVALVLFGLAVIAHPALSRVNLVAAGLACWVLAELVGRGLLHS
ncbi:MAG TPA: hypothetical protein VIN56_10140 [Candidatus Dormibacteraeota bacterium]